MKKTLLILAICIFAVNFSFAEDITLTTIMPSQAVLRGQKAAIGKTYVSAATVPDSTFTDNPDIDLLVEGSVGLGTTTGLDDKLTIDCGGSLAGIRIQNPGSTKPGLEVFGNDNTNCWMQVGNTTTTERVGMSVDNAAAVDNPANRVQAYVGSLTPNTPFSIGAHNREYIRILENYHPGLLCSVGIGTPTPRGMLDVNSTDPSGQIYCYTSSPTSSDYAEYFENEESVPNGSIVGIDMITGKVRKYRDGDELLGIVSSKPAILCNNTKDTKDNPRYTPVGILGQLEFNKNEVVIKNRIIYTKDGKKIGILLSTGKVLIK